MPLFRKEKCSLIHECFSVDCHYMKDRRDRHHLNRCTENQISRDKEVLFYVFNC